MKLLIPMFLVILTIGTATNIALIFLGYSKMLIPIAIISLATTINYFRLYKELCPKQYNAIKTKLAEWGAGASYAINKG